MLFSIYPYSISKWSPFSGANVINNRQWLWTFICSRQIYRIRHLCSADWKYKKRIRAEVQGVRSKHNAEIRPLLFNVSSTNLLNYIILIFNILSFNNRNPSDWRQGFLRNPVILNPSRWSRQPLIKRRLPHPPPLRGPCRRTPSCSLTEVRVTKKVWFQGLCRWENRSVLSYMRIFESSVTKKAPFLVTLHIIFNTGPRT